MWIRSQNKKILMDCKKIEITRNNIIVGFNGNFETLAIYSTEEKALKVLDMIEKRIIIGNKITKTFDSYLMDYTNNYNIEDYVFQMPKDEDVE